MKTAILARLVLGASFFLVLVSPLCPAQSPPPKTVLDYYKLLPGRFFEANMTERISVMLHPRRGAIVDSRNGYLFAGGDGAQTDIYLSLFKRRSGGYVIALKHYAVDTQDLTYLECLVYQGGSWADVTKSVIPVKLSDELKYELPRYRKIIRVRDKTGKRLYDLVWRGAKFRIRR